MHASPPRTGWSRYAWQAVLPLALVGSFAAECQPADALRPPAVPLVLHDPYFSIWSPHDLLTDGDTKHWTGAPHRLTLLARIDGQTYRMMGGQPVESEPLRQTKLQVTPTQTIYSFDHPACSLVLTFLTPALPDDLDLLARPVTYLRVESRAKQNAQPEVQLYLEARAEIAANAPAQPVAAVTMPDADLNILKVGTVQQPVLEKQGDDLRIDWGYFYLAAGKSGGCRAAILAGNEARAAFRAEGQLPVASNVTTAVPASAAPVLALAWNLGRIAKSAAATALVAYDDLFSLRYFDADLRPYWRRQGADAVALLKTAAAERAHLQDRCLAFDQALLADAERVGGPGYAQLVALCHRQSLAGTKLVADRRGQPLFFTKENNSNGCVGTVDVFYPQAPHLLLLSPALLKATLVPILDYAASPRWKFDFAPHDLGRYPHVTGQVYGGGERTLDRQMMVEESANMLLLIAALARAEGNADFARPYWPLLEKWAAYLEKFGYDPENQLSTDDFAGHLARNVNLSAKAICALGAFGQLAHLCGQSEPAAKFTPFARRLATQWIKDADDGGTHTRLAFDRPGTWSQKYNLVWDRVLGLGLFADEAIQREIKSYRTVSNRYGLPLDSRSTYTKLDWILWTAALAKGRDDFDALVNPVLAFVNATPDREPLTDWYFTDSGKRRGFKARPVVGGVFMPMLTDAAVWKKWSSQGANTSGSWAPLPLAEHSALAATGEDEPARWLVCSNRPANDAWRERAFRPGTDWNATDFPVGINSDSGTPIRTPWKSRDIWAVRDLELTHLPTGQVRVRLTHSGPVQFWINGHLALDRDSPVRGYQSFAISPEAVRALRVGSNRLALHTRSPRPQPQGRDVIDLGLTASAPARGTD